MKYNKALLLTLLFSIASVTACDKTPEEIKPGPTDIVIPDINVHEEVFNHEQTFPEKLILNHRMISLLADPQDAQQIRMLDQFNYDNSNLTFVSANPEIATVSETGLVTGVSVGETTVTVTDKDNAELKVVIPVIVNEEIVDDPATTDTDERLAAAAPFKDIDETNLKAIVDNEMYEKSVYKVDAEGNDILHSYSRWDQQLTASYDDAYMRILETDADSLTENGAVNYTKYEWVFYTDAFFDTYIFHQSGEVKNYFKVATQSYMEGERYQPIFDILANLFTSGSAIFTNTITNATMETFVDFATNDYSNVTNKLYGTTGEGNMLLACTYTFTDTATQDDETRYGIPYGTKIPNSYDFRFIIKDNQQAAYSIVNTATYSIGSQNYKEVYHIDHLYERIDEQKSQIFKPNKKDYTEVYSVFDV